MSNQKRIKEIIREINHWHPADVRNLLDAIHEMGRKKNEALSELF